jgi:predicted acyl esterase
MSTGRETQLQESAYELGPFRDEFVAMSDGVRLMTHVWIPKGQGPWPAILVRNPYVDGGNFKDPSLRLVTYGYAVVLQECRAGALPRSSGGPT